MSGSEVADAPHRPDGPSTLRQRFVKRLLTALAWTLVVLVIAGMAWATYRFNVNRFRMWPDFVRVVIPHLKIMGLCALALLAMTVIVVTLQLLASRWRTLRVFVTYHHAAGELASEITDALKRDRLDAQFIPFGERDHDTLIQDVRQRIRRCDAVVAIPGDARSFIDAELLSASTLGKPILIVRHRKGQTLPDTVYRGYPVFDISRLRGYDHHPLARLFRFACNHRRDVPLNLLRALSGTGTALMVMFSTPLVLAIPGMTTDLLITIGQTRLASTVAVWTYWVLLSVCIGAFVLAFARGVIAKFHAIRTVRQDIITREFTYESLERAFGLLRSDSQILTCLEREPLPLRHS